MLSGIQTVFLEHKMLLCNSTANNFVFALDENRLFPWQSDRPAILLHDNA